MSLLVDNLEAASTRLIPRGTEAVRLLTGYLMTLFGDPGIADASMCKLVVTHIYDLVAMAIGATREGQEVALGRGARAARLKAIKADFDRNLFDEDGTTFSAYASWTISAIAFEAGFGDLSHFNRSFRRRYGASPSEVRAEELRSSRPNS